jgi:hypothetical protein
VENRPKEVGTTLVKIERKYVI